MGDVKNKYYKDFLDGFLLNEISRSDIIKVLDNINHKYLDQARVLVLIAWSTGSRPNEYLRLTPEHFSRSKEFLEIKMPASKGSSARTVSLPRYMKSGEIDPLTKEIYDYERVIAPNQWLFWFFRSAAKRFGVTKRYTTRSGEIKEKTYDKIYKDLASKLRYYFPKWFNVIFDDGIPPYYLRHNRATKIMDKAGSGAALETFGWKKEETLRKYTHKTKKQREAIGEALLE